jgi:hypothetical protein
MTRRVSSIVALGAVALAPALASGCGNSPTDVGPPNLHVSISTAGVDKDADGYLLYGTGAPVRLVQTDGELLLAVPAGEYPITLDGIAGNCSLQSPATVSTRVEAAGTAVATFQLECRAVTASVQVVAAIAGRDQDANGYVIRVNGTPKGSVAWPPRPGLMVSLDSTLVEGLPAGAHTISLDDFSDNCELSAGPGSVDVQLSVGTPTRDVRRVAFETTCQATTGDVRVTTTTLGGAGDPNGYTLMVDDSLFVVAICPEDPFDFCSRETLRLAGNDSHLVQSLSPGDHPFELTDIRANCRVDGAARRTASVAIGAVVEVAFNLVCGTL